MTSPTPLSLERELLLASAGSGKTFQLSSRLIGLLAAGVPPQEILASTFTRKAAGEILDRVLDRLSEATLDEEKARELGRHLPRAEGQGELTSKECGQILVATVESLHRLQVHTLDAFFHRLVRLFEMELGLPGRWGIVDVPVMERLRSRALERSLREGDTGVLLELVRMAGRGEADRSVHDLLLEHLTSLLSLHRELAPGATGEWGEERADDPGSSQEEDELLRLALEALAEAELPRTRGGKGPPRALWVRALESVREAVEARDWDTFIGLTLVKRVVDGTLEYDRTPIEDDVAGPILALLPVAVRTKRLEVRGRLQALGRFLPAYDRQLRRLQRDEGAFDFNDLAYAILPGSGRTPVERLEDLHYRLDGRIRHVLLDEFQDTSTAQWGVLRPLVGEILSGYEGERAVFIVADPKQSIYGWRNGEPRIIDGIRSDFGLEPSSLSRSWRSSQTVLDLVNLVFRDPAGNPVVQRANIEDHAARWAAHFEPHEAAHRDRAGHVRVEAAPDGEDAEPGVTGDPLLHHTAQRVAELHRRAPRATIGILTRKNSTATRLIAELRAMGVGASEEGGVPVTDSAAVVCVLAAFRLADHPGDRISRYLVATSPLGEILGLTDWQSEEAAAEVSRALRSRLLRDGYGRTLSTWHRRLATTLSPRNRSRLRSLMELGYRWDERPTLRPADFVRAAESSRAESPGDEAIRVMTVHRAKGLQFDAVFLPELDGLSFSPGGLPPYLAEREMGGAGPVRRILPGVTSAWEPLFPELEEAARQHRESVARDALSATYVALTRAKHAVHVIMKCDIRGSSTACSGARFMRSALGLPKKVPPGEVLWEKRSLEQWEDGFLASGPGEEGEDVSARRGRRVDGPLRLARRERKRLLGRRSPSDMEGGEVVRLGSLLRPIPREALDRGSLVHFWMQQVEWLGPEGPNREELLRAARSRFPGARDPELLLDEVVEQLQAPPIRNLLSRENYPAGVRVERERPFVVREGGEVIQGVADRVVHLTGGVAGRLQVVDWKSDRIGSDPGELAERVRFYSPQIRAYCRALAKAEGVEPEHVEGVLAFLGAGTVVSVSTDGATSPGVEDGT
ncbi:MAG: UvrD-helicase domain-containing protein [Gemmatimonadota bacterium]